MDLNGFKAINDTYGHSTGDAALIRAAQLLAQGMRASDVVARFGGDEFVLLFPETTTAGAQRVLRRLGTMKTAVSEEVTAELRLTIAWGVATWPTDGPSPEQLLRTADRRLYEMKKRRQNGKRVRAARVAKRQIA